MTPRQPRAAIRPSALRFTGASSHTTSPAPGDKEETLQVVPRCSRCTSSCTTHSLDSMLWRLESADRAVPGHGGAMHDCSPIKLRKGKYKLKLLLRHPSPAARGAQRPTHAAAHQPPKGGGLQGLQREGHNIFMWSRGGNQTRRRRVVRRGAHRNLYVCAPTGTARGSCQAMHSSAASPLTPSSRV